MSEGAALDQAQRPNGKPPVAVGRPVALLAELTHRCPLRCPYCSNPLELARASAELATEEWRRVFGEAAALGVLQVHLSGGEPAARKDLEVLVEAAETAGLYTNLITSGLLLDRGRVAALAAAGLQHVQLSLQGTRPEEAEEVAGLRGSHAMKMAFAAHVHDEGLPLTVNAVVHRRNLDRLDEIVAMALELGARRLEIAHVQYHGWAAVNRAALLPDRAQVAAADATVAAARAELSGRLAIDYVPPDQYAVRPKACMNGWGRQFLVLTPTGRALPCHAAESLPGLDFPSARDGSLEDIWYRSDAFMRYRGTGWMPEPCRSCDRREIDWGGCRCQAFALTGDAEATDPTCALSPHRGVLEGAGEGDDAAAFVHRAMGRRGAR